MRRGRVSGLTLVYNPKQTHASAHLVTRRKKVKIRYLSDTDTALIEFSVTPVIETKEITENLYIDLDKNGNLVSMTIEHAKKQANISEISFLQMKKEFV